LPTLWWPHDLDRDLRARLRAEVAPDAQQDQHIMSQTSPERRHFPVPTSWPYAGSDPSRPGHYAQRSVRSLIRSERLPRCLVHASNLAGVQIPLPHPVGVTSNIEIGAAIKSP
jgi:hypothetical protein